MIIKKKNYIKLIYFDNARQIHIQYKRKAKFKPHFKINHNHAFFHKGFTAFLIAENKAETINPLDLKSAFNAKDFKTAIETKLINETFANLKTDKIDMVKLLLLGNVALSTIIIYFLMKMQEVI